MRHIISILGGLALALSLPLARAADAPATASPPTAAQPAKGAKNIGVAEFEKLRADKKNVVLDVRTASEYAAGHIPGAVNIDFNSPDFEKKVAALPKDKTYLVQCAVGGRSARACKKMTTLDFDHLYNLQGGIEAWEKAGNRPAK
ncbi:MAG TPA: rhodanese-like domain-containing protein [Verrucomicrobiae bacterium]|nr:rhodanese-like domain-containing protein [Verrucomicrobiae bacterium]